MTEGDHSVHLAESGDLSKLVDLHFAVFEDDTYLLNRFGRSMVQAVYEWLQDSEGTFTVVAKVHERLSGFAVVSPRPYFGEMISSLRGPLLRAALRRPWVIADRRLLARLRDYPKTRASSNEISAQIAILAVHPNARETGTALAILRLVIEECQERGWEKLSAGVYRTNSPARFLYATNGFTENASLSTDDLVAVENVFAETS